MTLRRAMDRASSESPCPGTAGIGTAVDDAVLDLILRRHAAEDADDFRAAADLLMQALTMLRCEDHPIDAGAVLHRIGARASRMGDDRSAWEAHLSAARLIHGCRAPGVLGDALGEAGLLLVRHRPADPIRHEVTHELLLHGVEDAVDHACEALLGAGPPSTEAAIVLHRRLTGMMLLATGAAADVVLTRGALALHHRVALPLAERHGSRPEEGWDCPGTIAFDALAHLYEAIGEQERPERAHEPSTFDEVRVLVGLVAIAFVGEFHPSVSRWLGSYLRGRRSAPWATEEVLTDIRSAA